MLLTDHHQKDGGSGTDPTCLIWFGWFSCVGAGLVGRLDDWLASWAGFDAEMRRIYQEIWIARQEVVVGYRSRFVAEVVAVRLRSCGSLVCFLVASVRKVSNNG